MNAPESIKKNGTNLQTDHLRDLTVQDEQSNQTKSGAGVPNGKVYVATNLGVF